MARPKLQITILAIGAAAAILRLAFPPLTYVAADEQTVACTDAIFIPELQDTCAVDVSVVATHLMVIAAITVALFVVAHYSAKAR